VAGRYEAAFSEIDELRVPARETNSTHVFHQYTLRVANGKRDQLKQHLQARGIPSMIYSPYRFIARKLFENLYRRILSCR
jgi:dTDP-4-amino-4,6-dideoxygalactose transaminase